MSYKNFASVYDRLMTDVSYQKRTQYLLKLFKKHGKVPTLLLDLACGTGGFSNEFALKGIEVIGVDMSEEMLSVARENSQSSGQN
jgi:ubiquinone/menaquinone biosynthesis C-methylase UbiE